MLLLILGNESSQTTAPRFVVLPFMEIDIGRARGQRVLKFSYSVEGKPWARDNARNPSCAGSDRNSWRPSVNPVRPWNVGESHRKPLRSADKTSIFGGAAVNEVCTKVRRVCYLGRAHTCVIAGDVNAHVNHSTCKVIIS